MYVCVCEYMCIFKLLILILFFQLMSYLFQLFLCAFELYVISLIGYYID